MVKPWRDPYQPCFSKAAISRLEPLIHDRVKKFLSCLEAAASTGNPVDLSMGYRSLTSDIITSYMFADKGLESLDVEGFKSPALEALEQFFHLSQWVVYFSSFVHWLQWQLEKLTKEQTERLSPELAATNWLSEVRQAETCALGQANVCAETQNESPENYGSKGLRVFDSHCFRRLG
jgi:hypothetical protein